MPAPWLLDAAVDEDASVEVADEVDEDCWLARSLSRVAKAFCASEELPDCRAEPRFCRSVASVLELLELLESLELLAELPGGGTGGGP